MATKEYDWNEIELGNEQVTEEDMEAAENSGKLPDGKWLVECVSTKPQIVDMKEKSSIAAKLEWEVLEALEIEGVKADKLDDKKRRMYEGRKIFDNVFMETADEPDWAKNRRVQIAKRCGLIPQGGGKMTKQTWANDIIGKHVVIATETQTDKKDPNKKYTGKVPLFDGYMSIEEYRSANGNAPAAEKGGSATKNGSGKASGADDMDDI